MLRCTRSLVCLAVFHVILFLSSLAGAAEISVFGAETFTRQSGSPVTETRTFEVPVARSGVIKLDNGLEDDTVINELVSSSVITLNGVTLFNPSEFNQNVSHLEETVSLLQGTNTLTVELRGKPGGTLQLQTFAYNESPTASFSATPSSGPVPLSVSFDASASSDPDNDITDYDWDYGDSSSGSGVTTSHTYTAPGTFTATLVVTDAFGVTATASTTITVTNTAPMASFTATPDTGDAPLTVGFDASASTDAENNIATYAWDFGDGSPADSGVTASHTYTTPGTYTATLTVTDAFGLTDQTTAAITVLTPNTAPVAAFTVVPQTGDAPLTVNLDASGSTDAENNIVSYAWDFGDTTTGSGLTATHIYGSPGTYVVTLTVTDAGGLTSTATQTVTAISPPPVASFTATPSSGPAPLTVNFDASASTDPNNDIASYSWDFGDGSPASAGVNVSHTFTSIGSFTVTLTVTDDFGAFDTVSQTITVTDPTPPIPGAIPAPPLVDNVSYNIATNTQFLYEGPNAVQTPASITTQDGGHTLAGTNGSADLSFFDRSWKLYNGLTVTGLSVYADAPTTVAIKVVQSLGGGTYSVMKNQGGFSHTGSGWEQFTFSTPITLPLEGEFHAGFHTSNSMLRAIERGAIAFALGDFTGTGTLSEASSGSFYGIKAHYDGAPLGFGNRIADYEDGNHATNGPISGAGLTVLDRSWAVDNGVTVTALSVYSNSAATVNGKIVRSLGAGQYEVVVNETGLSHSGNGWQRFELATPFVVPSSGTYYAAVYSGTNLRRTAVDISRAWLTADATGTFAATGETPGPAFLVRAHYLRPVFEPVRAAVVRGTVYDRDGNPLPGVTVTVAEHPEYGQTLSRADGYYDLAVNGGGVLRLDFEKTGYFHASRNVNAPWQDYAIVDDVALVAQDPVVTTFNLAAITTPQIHQGSVQTDGDGSRQTALLVNPGTTATMLVDGAPVALTSINVRTTEATVGDNGPMAMPMPLPKTSAYTFAANFSVDEALAAGATEVTFNQPVYGYVDNFLKLRAGSSVPSGYLDERDGMWKPSEAGAGRVVGIASESGGMANLDLDGDEDSDAADVALYATFNITDDERAVLAQTYDPGLGIWRVPMTHFSWSDWNYAVALLAGSTFPELPEPDHHDPVGKCNMCDHSVLQMEESIAGEARSVGGSSTTYNSDRTPGFAAQRSMGVNLTKATTPPPLDSIILTVDIAGRHFESKWDNNPFTPEPPFSGNLSDAFNWDGYDAYGRKVSGGTNAHVKIVYRYPMIYQRPPGAFFANPSSGVTPVLVSPSVESEPGIFGGPRRARTLVEFPQEFTVPLQNLDLKNLGLGGWTLANQHYYDAFSKTLHTGTGPRRSVKTVEQRLRRVTGNGALNGTMPNASRLTHDPEGNVYAAVLGTGGCQVKKVGLDGSVETVLGVDSATQCQGLRDLYFAPDGYLYFAGAQQIVSPPPSGLYSFIKRWNPQTNQVEDIIPFHFSGFSGDGGPAENAEINDPRGIVVDDSGVIYFTDMGNKRIRMILPDGTIHTIAGGTGVFVNNATPNASLGDGGPARSFHFSLVSALDIDSQGNLYALDGGTARIIRITPDGTANVIAGQHIQPAGDPASLEANYEAAIPGTDAWLDFASSSNRTLTVDGERNVWIGERYQMRVLTPDGILHPVTQRWAFSFNKDHPQTEDGRSVRTSALSSQGITVNPDGRLFATSVHFLYTFDVPLPGFNNTDITVPSEDGSEVYVFDSGGRHRKTFNSLTGAITMTYAYDSEGRLISTTDGDGDVTQYVRDGSGNLTSVINPDGLTTTVTTDANGYLASVTNPENETTLYAYSSDGLLEQITDPKLGVQTFTYDSLGRLMRDTDAAGGYLDLVRNEISDTEYEVVTTTSEGRVFKFGVDDQTSGTGGDTIRTTTDTAGLVTIRTERASGNDNTVTPDGTSTTVSRSADPRWGRQAPLEKLTITLPSSLQSSITPSRSFTGLDPVNPLSFTTMTDTLDINGRVFTSVFNKAQLKFTDTSAEGRTTTTFVDEQERITKSQIPNLFDTDFSYDGRGRLTTITQGTGADTRTSTILYNAQGFVDSVTDAENRIVSFTYDNEGRVLTQTLPDLRVITFTYDDNGNVASITPPGRPAHGFDYTPVNLEDEYTPPNVPGVTQPKTFFQYNLDKQPTLITRPDGQTIAFNYDTAGRLDNFVIPRGTTTFAYNAITGNLDSITAPGPEALAFTYDGSLPLSTTWSGTVNGAVSRTYDNSFRITSRSVNGSNTINFTYDDDDLLTAAGSETLTNDPLNGLLTGTTLGVVTDSYGYSQFGELDSYTANTSGTPVFQTAFLRDKLGRITQKTETVSGVTHVYEYAYDDAGRLMEVKKDSVITATYTYDDNSNRLNNSAVYDDQDRLTATSTATYTYTDNGELATKTDSSGTTTYSYDVLGSLMSVLLSDFTSIEYIVDGFGRRVGKKVNGILKQQFLYLDHPRPVAELDELGNLVSQFIYGSNSTSPDFIIREGITYKIISDHLGSPRLVIDSSSGTIVQELDYDEWGNVLFDTNPGFQPFGFAGGLFDPDTKLVRFGARDYDPEIGRWTSKDLIKFRGNDLNLFGYVANDPLNFIDPSGLIKRTGEDPKKRDPRKRKPPKPPEHKQPKDKLPELVPADEPPPDLTPAFNFTTCFLGCMRTVKNPYICAGICAIAALGESDPEDGKSVIDSSSLSCPFSN